MHGRDATEVHARDLTLDKFLDEATLAAAPSLPGPTSEVRTVLLTGDQIYLKAENILYPNLHPVEKLDIQGVVVSVLRTMPPAVAA